jgi:hypothetical protein
MLDNEGLKVPVGAEIKFNSTKTKAFIRLYGDCGSLPDVNMIKVLIKHVGITYGIKNNVIKDIAENPVLDEDIEIATGKLPVDGENGKITYLITTDKPAIPKTLPDGRVDYHDLSIVNNVKKGDIIAKISLPKKGIKGIDVFGSELKAKDGKPAVSPIGKNVVTNGNELISKIDGQPVWVNGKINIFQVFNVNGDVDYSVGNINFVGSVHIHGNVNSGFKIRANGDIIIEGVLDSSDVVCDGNIFVRDGIQGSGKGSVKCKGNLTTKYIENSELEVQGSVYCEAILYSKVACNNGIHINGKHGVITNSTVKARNEIIANNIGSSMYAYTEIEVGFDPSIINQIATKKDDIKKLNKRLLKVNKIISYLRQTFNENADVKHKLLYEKSILTQKTLKAQLNNSNEALLDLNKKMNISNETKIIVCKKLYQGVKITIGSNTIITHQDYYHVLLKEKDAQIAFLPI